MVTSNEKGKEKKDPPGSSKEFSSGRGGRKEKAHGNPGDVVVQEFSMQRLCEVIRMVAFWRLRICLQFLINKRILHWHACQVGKCGGSQESILSLKSPCWG